MCLAVRRDVFFGLHHLSPSFLSVLCSVDLEISILSILRFCKRAFTNFSQDLSCRSERKFLSFSSCKVLNSVKLFKLQYDALNS